MSDYSVAKLMVIHFQPGAWALWNWHFSKTHLPTLPELAFEKWCWDSHRSC